MHPTDIVFSLIIAVWSWVYVARLQDRHKILHPFRMLLDRIVEYKVKEDQPIPYWREYLAKPIYKCDECHGGQVAFWFFLTAGKTVVIAIVLAVITIFFVNLIRTLFHG
jgi:hypothetical protein